MLANLNIAISKTSTCTRKNKYKRGGRDHSASSRGPGSTASNTGYEPREVVKGGAWRGGKDGGSTRGASRGASRGGDRGASRGAARGSDRGASRGGARGGDRGASRGGDRGGARGGRPNTDGNRPASAPGQENATEVKAEAEKVIEKVVERARDEFEIVPAEEGLAAPFVAIVEPKKKVEEKKEEVAPEEEKKEIPEKTHRGHRNEVGDNQEAKPKVTTELEVKDDEDEQAKEAEVFSGEKFSELPINDKLKETLAAHGFDELTEI